ncbi:MAG: hypothetical protein L0Y56_19170 [Nitrospira sp.]|nr:hypothetical protein [Nitrospira sp.]
MKQFGLAVLGAFVLLFISVVDLPIVRAAAPASLSEPSAPPEVTVRQFNGKVVSLDLQTQRLIVKNRKGESAFVLTSKTAYKKSRSAVQPAALKPGMKVLVRYHEQDNQRIAGQVTITSAPKKGRP